MSYYDESDSEFNDEYLLGKPVTILGENPISGVVENITRNWLVLKDINRPEPGNPNEENDQKESKKSKFDPLLMLYIPMSPPPAISMRRYD